MKLKKIGSELKEYFTRVWKDPIHRAGLIVIGTIIAATLISITFKACQ